MFSLESPHRGISNKYTQHTIININKKIIQYYPIYIEDIYFLEVNTKYISSNVMKISVNSRVRSTSEFYDIFNT